MVEYPDNWVIIKLSGDDPHYRVLAGWSGGFTTGDSWKLNSGITSVDEDGHFYYFYGSSGSCYQCDDKAYGLRMNNVGVWNQLKELQGDKVELMDEDTDWLSIDWIIGD